MHCDVLLKTELPSKFAPCGEHLQGGRFCGCGIFGDLQWGVLCRLDITSSELYIVEFKFVGTLRGQDYQSARRGQACDREVCGSAAQRAGLSVCAQGLVGVVCSRNFCHTVGEVFLV